MRHNNPVQPSSSDSVSSQNNPPFPGKENESTIRDNRINRKLTWTFASVGGVEKREKRGGSVFVCSLEVCQIVRELTLAQLTPPARSFSHSVTIFPRRLFELHSFIDLIRYFTKNRSIVSLTLMEVEENNG